MSPPAPMDSLKNLTSNSTLTANVIDFLENHFDCIPASPGVGRQTVSDPGCSIRNHTPPPLNPSALLPLSAAWNFIKKWLFCANGLRNFGSSSTSWTEDQRAAKTAAACDRERGPERSRGKPIRTHPVLLPGVRASGGRG